MLHPTAGPRWLGERPAPLHIALRLFACEVVRWMVGGGLPGLHCRHGRAKGCCAGRRNTQTVHTPGFACMQGLPSAHAVSNVWCVLLLVSAVGGGWRRPRGSCHANNSPLRVLNPVSPRHTSAPRYPFKVHRHEKNITGLDFSSDGRWLVVTDEADTIVVYDALAGRCVGGRTDERLTSHPHQH